MEKYLYKIVTKEQWQESLHRHEFVLSDMDRPFIHLSTEDQIQGVVEKYFRDSDYLVLKLDVNKLKGRLVLEANPGKTAKFYHLYNGYIPLDAVVEVK